jgi:hypothetical protein
MLNAATRDLKWTGYEPTIKINIRFITTSPHSPLKPNERVINDLVYLFLYCIVFIPYQSHIRLIYVTLYFKWPNSRYRKQSNTIRLPSISPLMSSSQYWCKGDLQFRCSHFWWDLVHLGLVWFCFTIWQSRDYSTICPMPLIWGQRAWKERIYTLAMLRQS